MATDRNLDLLARVARQLVRSREEFVFVGGAVMGLLTTDPGVEEPRPTDDVDVIVQVASRVDYQLRLVPELRRLGFEENVDARTTCAWRIDGVRVDVMPTDDSILGFTNRWYGPAMAHAAKTSVRGIRARVITAPYFLATKFEAFRGRGAGDYYGSHDLEDIVTVVDGRQQLIGELIQADAALQDYIGQEIEALLANEDFVNALPGYSRQPGRAAIVVQRLKKLASADPKGQP